MVVPVPRAAQATRTVNSRIASGASLPVAPSPSRRRRRPSRWLQACLGGLLAGSGVLLLLALMLIPEGLDALLLVSTAIAHVIGGLSRLAMGLAQLAAVLLVVLLALLALLLMLGGLLRLLKALLPPLSHEGAAPRSRPAARRTTGRSAGSATAARQVSRAPVRPWV